MNSYWLPNVFATQDPLCRKTTMLLVPSIRDIAMNKSYDLVAEYGYVKMLSFFIPMAPLRCLLTTCLLVACAGEAGT